MAQATHNERLLISLVEKGILEIDAQGNIWRYRKGRRCLATRVSRRGYLTIRATINGIEISTYAHRLVYHYFYGPIPDGREVNHKNGVRADNRPENLEAITHSENMEHAIGFTKIVAYKLTANQVREIRRRRANGEKLIPLANEYGVTHSAIIKIMRGDSYANVSQAVAQL